MGRKRGAKARQKEAERRRQLQQHGVTVLGSKGRPLSKKSGNAKRKLKNTQAFLDRQLEGTNPFATKRGSGASIRVRQKTLLHDYKSRKRSTVFADKRLGEYDMGMDTEEKTLLRLAKERTRSFRDKDKFNLDLEGDEEDFEERAELLPSDDDEIFDEDEEPLTAESMAAMATKFGGMEKKRGADERVQLLDEELAKKRAEVADPLQELMDLDEEYTDMEQQVVQEANVAVKTGRVAQERDTNDFDKLVFKLGALPRNPASDPVKTQEERDKQYQKELEQLEKERIRRMTDDGTAEPDAADEGGVLDIDALLRAKENQRSTAKKQDKKGKDLKVLSPEEDLSKLSLPQLLRQHLMAIPSGAGKTDTLTRRYNVLWRALEKFVADTKGANLAPINRAVRTLFEMTQKIPRPAAHWCRAWCRSLQQQLAEKTNPNYPRLSHLIVLQLLPILFPSSDFRHPVMTPAFLLMSCLLSSCSVASLRNIAAGLYVCTCYLESIRETKRFVPEAVSFLTSTILLTSDKHSRASCLPPFQRLPKSKRNMLQYTQQLQTPDNTKLPMQLVQVGIKQLDEDEAQAKHKLAFSALRLLSSALRIYSCYPAVYDACVPIVPCLRGLAENSNCPDTARGLSRRLANKIEKESKAPREHLQLQKHKPVPLPELVPEFEAVFIDRKGRKIPKEERATARLQHQYKQERKGAIKELRKDTAFLARVRLEEQRELDAERFQKVREIENLMADSRFEEKQLKRAKH